MAVPPPKAFITFRLISVTISGSGENESDSGPKHIYAREHKLYCFIILLLYYYYIIKLFLSQGVKKVSEMRLQPETGLTQVSSIFLS